MNSKYGIFFSAWLATGGCQVGTPGIGEETGNAISNNSGAAGAADEGMGPDSRTDGPSTFIGGETGGGSGFGDTTTTSGPGGTTIGSDTGSTSEATGSGKPQCEVEPEEIIGVEISSDMGECCGSPLSATIDRSGLMGWDLEEKVHDCGDGTGWSSNFTFSGQVRFDFPALYLISKIYVWNHGEHMGQRGVKDVSIETVLDGVVTPLANGPSQFARVLECPVMVEVISVDPPVMAQSVRFNIENSYNEGGLTTLGLAEVAFIGEPCS